MQSPDALHDQLLKDGYSVTARCTFTELIHLVKQGFGYRNIFATGYWALLVLQLVLLAVDGRAAVWSGALSAGAYIGWAAAGIPLTLLLIPLHEGIHGWMFRLAGATRVRYGMVPRYLMFYAVAHLFVAGYRQYLRIGLAPCAIIGALCLLSMIWAPPAGQALALGTLFFHTSCCAGDFGLCAYMHHFRHRQVVSFDDADAGVTWFYCKEHA